MNRVLILANGTEANSFLREIKESYNNIAEYDIVYKNDSDIQGITKIDGITFFKLDFSHFISLKFFAKNNYSKIFVVIKNRYDAIKVYEQLKYLKIETPIEFVKFWDIEVETFNNTNIINSHQLLVNKLTHMLPNVPVYAKDVGLGKGEILEVQVPVSSPYAYKTISSLYNKDTRVVAIYRNDELILPKQRNIIFPNDSLLIVGKPNILKDLFKSIKEEKGTFPTPFGNNIYLLLDMLRMDRKLISKLLKTALHLHRNLKSRKLIIKVINPTVESKLSKLMKFPNIDIVFDYFNSNYIETIKNDRKVFNIGIVVINGKFFYKYMEELRELKVPILKIGLNSIKECKNSIILLEDNKKFEEISPVIFDVSSQLNIKIRFLDIDPEAMSGKEIINHFKKLSNLYYYKNVEFVSSDTSNPIKFLKDVTDSCVFIPFLKNLSKSRVNAFLFPSIDKSYLFLDNITQLFIPIEGEL